MENPRQLPSGKWQGRVTGPDGKRYSAGVHTSYRKAQQAQAMKLAELEAEEDDDPRSQTLFSNYAEQHLWSRRPGEINGYAPTSYYKRLHDLKELNKAFGHRYLEEIRPSEIRAWWIRKGNTPSRRQALYWFMNQIFEVAMTDELITMNPCRVRDASTSPTKKRPTFTDSDMEKVIAAAQDEQMRIMLLVLAGTALRIGELVALDWSDIAFFDSKLHVTKHWTPKGIAEGTKTGREKVRSIVMPAWVVKALESLYRVSDGDGAIFRHKRGGRLSVDGAEKRFEKIRERAGYPQMHIHDVRHVALTNYARLPGVTLKEIMAFGGHESERTAMGYQHTEDERAVQLAAASVAPRWVKS